MCLTQQVYAAPSSLFVPERDVVVTSSSVFVVFHTAHFFWEVYTTKVIRTGEKWMLSSVLQFIVKKLQFVLLCERTQWVDMNIAFQLSHFILCACVCV